MHWASLTVGIAAICWACNSSRAPANMGSQPMADTTVLQRQDSQFVTGPACTNLPLRLDAIAQQALRQNTERATWILLDGPALIEPPDGVYEAYITVGPCDNAGLTDTHPGFVGVLNLYDEAGPDAKGYVALPLKATLQGLVAGGKARLALLFRGNGLPGGGSSPKAGSIRFTGLRLVQTIQ
jgi:hypothetical protein